MIEQLLKTWNWNILFLYSGSIYRIYQTNSLEYNLLGSGATPDEAIFNAWKYSVPMEVVTEKS